MYSTGCPAPFLFQGAQESPAILYYIILYIHLHIPKYISLYIPINIPIYIYIYIYRQGVNPCKHTVIWLDLPTLHADHSYSPSHTNQGRVDNYEIPCPWEGAFLYQLEDTFKTNDSHLWKPASLFWHNSAESLRYMVEKLRAGGAHAWANAVPASLAEALCSAT